AVVLRRDHGLAHERRNLIRRHGNAILEEKFSDELAVAIEHDSGGLHFLDIGEVELPGAVLELSREHRVADQRNERAHRQDHERTPKPPALIERTSLALRPLFPTVI